MRREAATDRVTSSSDLALLVLRLALGAAFITHGFPKILHPATWAAHVMPGLPSWLAAVAAFVEFAGGIAVAAGFLTPFFAFLIACDMVVAILFVLVPHGAPYVSSAPGSPSYELPLAYLALSLALILLGPGALAVDARTRKRSKRNKH
jgi:putative oxidoreductase